MSSVALDLELPIDDVVDRSIFAIASVVGRDDGVVCRDGGFRHSASIGLLLCCHVVYRDKPRVGAKTIGGGYPLERTRITITQRLEVEASFANSARDNNTKINASIIASCIQCPINHSYTGIYCQ